MFVTKKEHNADYNSLLGAIDRLHERIKWMKGEIEYDRKVRALKENGWTQTEPGGVWSKRGMVKGLSTTTAYTVLMES